MRIFTVMPAQRVFVLLSILLTLSAAVTSATADGKVFFPIGTAETGRMPDQRALLAFDGTIETLVIDTRYTGPASEAAWLVPLPSVPTIEPATDGLFPTLEALFATRVRHHVRTPAVPFLVLATVALLIGMLARKVRSFLLVTLVVFFTCVIPLGLPALGKARRSSSTPGVAVLQRQLVGVYDTAVLSGDEPAAVIGWLERNGFMAPDGVEPVIADYLAAGWVFAATKLHAPATDSSAEPFTPHPLAFRFETDEPVYPVRLTGVGNGELEIDLYVIANGRASASGWQTSMSLPTAFPEEKPYFKARRLRQLDEPIIVTNPELARIVGQGTTATHLNATLSETAMREDVRLTIGPPRAYVPRVYTSSAARQIGSQLMFVAMVVSLVTVHAVRFALAWTTIRSLAVGVAAIAGSVSIVPITHLVLAEVPDASLVNSRGVDDRIDLHMRVWGEMWDEFNARERDSFTLADVESRAEELMREHSVEWGMAPPVLQDSPGNATFRERPDGTIVYDAHDRVGTPLLIGYVWEPPNADPEGP